jgi:hypothetical protein
MKNPKLPQLNKALDPHMEDLLNSNEIEWERREFMEAELETLERLRAGYLQRADTDEAALRCYLELSTQVQKFRGVK